VDDSGTSHVKGDAVGVGAVTGPSILGCPGPPRLAGRGGTAPRP
jgi:hypothetical protein